MCCTNPEDQGTVIKDSSTAFVRKFFILNTKKKTKWKIIVGHSGLCNYNLGDYHGCLNALKSLWYKG